MNDRPGNAVMSVPFRVFFALLATAMVAFLIALVAGVANAPGPAADAEPGDETSTAACQAGKIRFTQAEGCMNDGYVEFCIPDDAEALARIRAIDPEITCGPGRGRAGCGSGEQLCLMSVAGDCPPESREAPLSDAGWGRVCALAGLDIVREIVPTWFE
jgi:hypothetical protein